MDLIHELDSARWLCGEIDDVKAFSEQVSTLEIATECVGAVMRSDSGLRSILALTTLPANRCGVTSWLVRREPSP